MKTQKLTLTTLLVITTFLTGLLFAGSLFAETEAPIAKIIPDTTRIHGYELVDNYSWLKDKTRLQPDVVAYIEAENNYTAAVMARSQKMQDRLYEEFSGRMIEVDVSVPVQRGDYLYYSRQDEGMQYSLYCRKSLDAEAKEEIYLDENELAAAHKFFSMTEMNLSPDDRYLAFAVDTTGAENYHLVIKDLTNGQYLSDYVNKVSDISWANDNKTLFYSTIDEAGRTNKIFRHKLGNRASEDELLFTEKDERYWTWVFKSRDKKYIVIGSGSKITSEYQFLSSDDPDGKFQIVEPRREGHDYYIIPHNEEFYIVTNSDAKNNKLMVTSITEPGEENWKEVLSARDDVMIHAGVSKKHLIISERDKGIVNLRIINLENKEEHYVEFPEPVYSYHTWSTTPYDSNLLRITYESLITPYQVYDYDMDTREKTVLKQKEVKGGYNVSEYVSERFFAKGHDGVEIPISLVYKKDLFRKDGTNPLYLEAYGAYGDNSDPYFSTVRLSLLDRGVVCATAHVRGGKEMGESWYEQGKMFNKKNTFKDFISCAEFLKSEKYGGEIVAEGGSAGGLLMGAITNMRPDLFAGVVADVPFVDITNTMLDPTLSAVVSEYEEWGNPNIKEQFDYIHSYAPYDNVTAQDYPDILVLGGFYDTRVNFWEPAKWVAKLRATKTDDNLILLKTNMNAGHGGSSGRYDYLHEITLRYTFMLNVWGIEE